jgi:hypothetical protein
VYSSINAQDHLESKCGLYLICKYDNISELVHVIINVEESHICWAMEFISHEKNEKIPTCSTFHHRRTK